MKFVIEKTSGATDLVEADSAEKDGPVIRFVAAGRVVATYRAGYVAAVKEQHNG